MRFANIGSGATAGPVELRLEVLSNPPWSQQSTTDAPLLPGSDAELRFAQVPLPAGLSLLKATVDPEGRLSESNEQNNQRTLPRDPQQRCGASLDTLASATVSLSVQVRKKVSSATAGEPLPNATLRVINPLGAGTAIATALSDGIGEASFVDLSMKRWTPVLRVEAEAPNCQPAAQVFSTVEGSARVSLDLECDTPAAAPGVGALGLVIEAALPGFIQLDDSSLVAIQLGERYAAGKAGDEIRVRAMSRKGTLYFDQRISIPTSEPLILVVDGESPVLVSAPGIVENLRNGQEWNLAADSIRDHAAATDLCNGSRIGELDDWRLPTIDELGALANVIEGTGDDSRELLGLTNCCAWSATSQGSNILTYYFSHGHIYARRADERGLAALCVRGETYSIESAEVPLPYRDRLPPARIFAPPLRAPN